MTTAICHSQTQTVGILQITFPSSLSYMRIVVYLFKCHWHILPRMQLRISQHWSIWWLDAKRPRRLAHGNCQLMISRCIQKVIFQIWKHTCVSCISNKLLTRQMGMYIEICCNVSSTDLWKLPIFWVYTVIPDPLYDKPYTCSAPYPNSFVAVMH